MPLCISLSRCHCVQGYALHKYKFSLCSCWQVALISKGIDSASLNHRPVKHDVQQALIMTNVNIENSAEQITLAAVGLYIKQLMTYSKGNDLATLRAFNPTSVKSMQLLHPQINLAPSYQYHCLLKLHIMMYEKLLSKFLTHSYFPW